jgi:putative endonuclease
MFTVYIMQSLADGRRYIGSTQDLLRRHREHQMGETRSTRGRGPWQVIYTEVYAERSEAVRRERYLKALKSRVALERLINRAFSEIGA